MHSQSCRCVTIDTSHQVCCMLDNRYLLLMNTCRQGGSSTVLLCYSGFQSIQVLSTFVTFFLCVLSESTVPVLHRTTAQNSYSMASPPALSTHSNCSFLSECNRPPADCFCLQHRALPESEVLVMLRSASKPALWRYLDHLLSGISPRTSSSTVSPQLHTELALVLLEEALRLAPELATSAAAALPPRIEDGALHANAPSHCKFGDVLVRGPAFKSCTERGN